MYHVTTQAGCLYPTVIALAPAISLSLNWKYCSFLEPTVIPFPHGTVCRPIFYHFVTLGFCFLCVLCVEYQTRSHSPALKTGYDGLRCLYGILTLPTLCNPFCSHGLILLMRGHIKHCHSRVSVCPIAVVLSLL